MGWLVGTHWVPAPTMAQLGVPHLLHPTATLHTSRHWGTFP